MQPSLRAPIFTRTWAPEVGPLARNTSSRVIAIFTGLRAFLARARAIGSR